MEDIANRSGWTDFEFEPTFVDEANITHHKLDYRISDADHILMTIYLLMILVPGTFLNGIVIYLTAKYNQFHTPYMYVKSTSAVMDIMLEWGLIPHTILNDHLGDSLPSRCMCYGIVFGLGSFYLTAQFTAVVALERYFYFCRPFLYQRWFTLKSIIAATVFMFSVTQTYTFTTEIIYKRELQPIVAICQLQVQTTHNVIQFCLFFLPSIIATVFSVYKISKLIDNKVDVVTGTSFAGYLSKPEVEGTKHRRSARRSIR